MTYGETVILLRALVELFELIEVDLLVGDLHQMMITLKRR